MNRAVARALWAGTLTGVGLCAAATLARALELAVAPRLAQLGVLALFVTPPLRLAVVASAFWREGSRRHAAAALAVLTALLATAAKAALR
ncbi:MAG TPA: DUF1634 domain-containing protein [Anaeromyxobacter sp.]